MTGTRVTCEDLDTGESESIEIRDNFLLITDGYYHLTNEQHYANGTVVLTLKRQP